MVVWMKMVVAKYGKVLRNTYKAKLIMEKLCALRRMSAKPPQFLDYTTQSNKTNFKWQRSVVPYLDMLNLNNKRRIK
jgi:hypothetical protein